MHHWEQGRSESMTRHFLRFLPGCQALRVCGSVCNGHLMARDRHWADSPLAACSPPLPPMDCHLGEIFILAPTTPRCGVVLATFATLVWYVQELRGKSRSPGSSSLLCRFRSTVQIAADGTCPQIIIQGLGRYACIHDACISVRWALLMQADCCRQYE